MLLRSVAKMNGHNKNVKVLQVKVKNYIFA